MAVLSSAVEAWSTGITFLSMFQIVIIRLFTIPVAFSRNLGTDVGWRRCDGASSGATAHSETA